MRSKDWLALLGFVALSEAAGALGALFTAPAIAGWYAMLARPALSPPNWVFAPVWSLLFLLMGVAAFLVWRKGWSRAQVRSALKLFFLQLILNALWSIIFFGMRRPGLALLEIALLFLAITATLIAFARVCRPAAWLLAPYLLWVSFAVYLNHGIWMLNR